MTPLAEACTDLIAWLPHAQALIAEPDTQPTAGRTQPGSKPPWNSQAANIRLDIHAGARELEQNLRYRVSGTLTERGGSDTNTVLALEAAARLAEAVDHAIADAAARLVAGWITVMMQLPAIDLEDPPRRLPAQCPRCDRGMLRAFMRDGRVACLGCGARGQMRPGTLSEGFVEWLG